MITKLPVDHAYISACEPLRKHRQCGNQRIDPSAKLLDTDMLVGGMVEARIARTIGNNRALPDGRHHVHIGGAGFA